MELYTKSTPLHLCCMIAYIVLQDVVYTSYFKSLPPVIPEDAPKKASVVPLTWGNRPMPSSQVLINLCCMQLLTFINQNGLVVIFSNHKSKVAEFCNDINSFEVCLY